MKWYANALGLIPFVAGLPIAGTHGHPALRGAVVIPRLLPAALVQSALRARPLGSEGLTSKPPLPFVRVRPVGLADAVVRGATVSDASSVWRCWEGQLVVWSAEAAGMRSWPDHLSSAASASAPLASRRVRLRGPVNCRARPPPVARRRPR